jgi:hypothetical protein
MTVTRLTLMIVCLVLALAPSSALARGGGGGGGDNGGRQEVRVAGSCGKGATARLRLRSQDGRIRAQLEIDHARSGAIWRVSLVQERHVVYRGRARTRLGQFEVERRLSDLPGADIVTARAVGPRGLTCVAAATLPG